MPTPPLFNFSTSTCETPRGACPTALRRLPTQSTQTLPRGRREDSSLRPWAAKKGSLKSSLSPPARAKGGGVGWTEEKNFLLKFVFQLVKGTGRSLKSPGLRGVGGGGTPHRLTAGRGRGAPEVEGAWDKRGRPGSGAGGCTGPWGQGAAGVPPTWRTKQLPRSALTRSFVFSIRASWVGVVRAPRARGAPSRAGGRRLSPGLRRLQGSPGWAQTGGCYGNPRISPL